MEINPYLTFPGTCAEAMEFYAEVFGGQVETLMIVGDTDVADKMPAEMQDKVMHARVRIGGQSILASDAIMHPYEPPKGITVQTGFTDLGKARRVFSRLSKNGEVVMPFEPTFWAAGFGMCNDRYGVPWMVNCDVDTGAET